MCGTCASCSFKRKTVTPEILETLGLIQNRGQDSVGLATTNSRHRGVPTRHWKEPGSAHKWFNRETGGPLVDRLLRELRGDVGIGHVRYATASLRDGKNAQPHYFDFGGQKIILASNGDIPFCERERRRLKRKGYPFASRCDAEVLAKSLGDHLWTYGGSEEDAFIHMGQTLQAAYSLSAITPSKRLFVMRDPYGFRPYWWTKNKDGFHVCSESAVIASFGKPYEVEPGTLMTVDTTGKIEVHRFADCPIRRCLMEYYYYARPDSLFDSSGELIDGIRFQLGVELAREISRAGYPIPEVVIPVPYSGNPAAEGCAAELHKLFRTAIIKDRFSERIFQQDEMARSELVRRRFSVNPGPLVHKKTGIGKVVVVVDDSIVRGDQARALVPDLRAAGAGTIIYAATAPPHRFPCFFGINTPDPERLIAHGKTEKQVKRLIRADHLHYLTLDSTFRLLGRDFCTACFTGDYPLPVPAGRAEV